MTGRNGEIPGVRWPAPEPADPERSQIVEPPDRCGACPKCGCTRKAARPDMGQTA